MRRVKCVLKTFWRKVIPGYREVLYEIEKHQIERDYLARKVTRMRDEVSRLDEEWATKYAKLKVQNRYYNNSSEKNMADAPIDEETPQYENSGYVDFGEYPYRIVNITKRRKYWSRYSTYDKAKSVAENIARSNMGEKIAVVGAVYEVETEPLPLKTKEHHNPK